MGIQIFQRCVRIILKLRILKFFLEKKSFYFFCLNLLVLYCNSELRGFIGIMIYVDDDRCFLDKGLQVIFVLEVSFWLYSCCIFIGMVFGVYRGVKK